MITIVISACLVADMKVCENHNIPLESNWDTRRCAMYAPPHFAQWEERNPKWRVVKWRCKPGNMDDI